MPDPIGDPTTRALSLALSGLSLRQRTIADNVANIGTPGYKAGRVDFETNLATAYANGQDPATAQIWQTRSAAPGGLNGNNVNLDEETLDGTETGLAYQLGVQAMTDHFQRMRLAIGGAGA